MATDMVLSDQTTAIERRETAADVLAASAKALVQARYMVAYSRPRDWDLVRQKVMKDCERTSFAETAMYSKPVGGSTISGLSVRFAESAQRALTNILPERTIIFDAPDKRIVRISVTDLESNVTHSKDLILAKTVERKTPKSGTTVLGQRLNSHGQVVYIVEATEEELLVKESAMSSKVERQLTLKILPGDIQDEAISKIRETLRKQDKQDPDAAKKKIVDAFDDMGVHVNDLKEYLAVASLDGLQPNDLAKLRQIYTAIKDGETNWREIMEQRDAARGDKEGDKGARTQSITDKLKARNAPKAKAEAAPEPPAEPPAELTGDLKTVHELFGILDTPASSQAAFLKSYEGKLPDLVKMLQSKLPEDGE